MSGIEKQAAFYRGYLVDDRGLAALTTALATIVGLWLLVYVVGAIAPLAGPHMGERAGQASSLASRTP
jgi:hypothetical protein